MPRSQFGETHEHYQVFEKSQLIGFTGTPIFAENASKNDLGKRTTKDLFGNCLHKYVITDAIRDQNVLRFGIEYVGNTKQEQCFISSKKELTNKSTEL
jgi:type I restriction enzyme R subunit